MFGNLEDDVKKLLETLEKSQWKPHTINPDYLSHDKIITRDDLRNIKMQKGFYTSKSSGSTGEPVSVEKTYQDLVWYYATNIREIRWRKWDVTKNIAVIRGNGKEKIKDSWGIPKNIEPVQGKMFVNDYKTIPELQKWLEECNPHYIHCFPSIYKQLDLSKLSNFIDWKGTGEVGGTSYTTEECGTIAIQCPDNPLVMHVMENIYVEVNENWEIIVTSFTNPYIKKYLHGDKISMGVCGCGRTLQTINRIFGRVRNYFVLPDGSRKFPLLGSQTYYEKFGIKRFKAIQTTLYDLELHIISEPLNEREEEFKNHVKGWINSEINVIIKYVENFPNYKHEEFISLV